MTLDPTESTTQGFPFEFITKVATSTGALRLPVSPSVVKPSTKKKKASNILAAAAEEDSEFSTSDIRHQASELKTATIPSASSFLPLSNQRAPIPTDLEWSPAVVCGLATPPPHPHPPAPTTQPPLAAPASAPHFPPTSAAEVGAAAASTVTALAAAVADSAQLVGAAVKGEDVIGGKGGSAAAASAAAAASHVNAKGSSGAGKGNEADAKNNAAADAANGQSNDPSSIQSTPGGERRGLGREKPLMISHSAPDMALVSMIRQHVQAEAMADIVGPEEDGSRPEFGLSLDDDDDEGEDDEDALDEVRSATQYRRNLLRVRF